MRTLLLAPDERDLLGGLLRGAAPGVEVIRPVTRSRDELRALLPDVDIVVGDWSGRLPLGAAEAEIGGHLRLLQQPGVGVNWIDVDAWRQAGVPVANTPGANAASVAEWAVVATASLSRSMGWAHDRLRAGDWPQERILDHDCRDLGERRVGIVGFGDIGRRCVGLFAAFGCEVAYTARRPRSDASARHLPFDDLLAVSDVLVLAVPLTPSTRGLIGASELARLPEGAIVVNVARGPVVRTDALVAGLRSGRLGGAALDVFDREPLAADSELRRLDRVLLSPHVAGGSATARRRIYEMTAANVARVCHGGAPEWTL
ncbi:2-hydroxyacid dehydrogenase [Rhodococcus sp. D-6]|uniref:Dehydrogenase n=2 Tax=Rhodococcus TaxID=1827 RepID=V9XP81_9NOCA|nr:MULTISPECIES: 2-hydroxyacid dehydrogenase [Rhodococcus]AHD23162.1 dehydrogenase [Rhodococcus pyridinivorans SB3094]MCT7291737.1 2-hydroxyacid dehydrogenase [Rhodococcus sp. PAE-6]